MADKVPRLDRRLLGRLAGVVAPYRGWVVLSILLTVGTSLLGPLRPKLVQVAIDRYVVSGDAAGLMRV
ncbi:MAG TPA: hypothetical protein VK610_08255, partial [Rhodothermales bacterium]|nr:hypothetical protein [Rhodothermales bacterium]